MLLAWSVATPARAAESVRLGLGGWHCAAVEGDVPPAAPAAWQPCVAVPDGVTRLWAKTELPRGDWATPAIGLTQNPSARALAVDGVRFAAAAAQPGHQLPPVVRLPALRPGAELQVLLEAGPNAPLALLHGHVGEAAELRLGVVRETLPFLAVAALLGLIALAGMAVAGGIREGRGVGLAFASYAACAGTIVIGMSQAPALLLGHIDGWLNASFCGAALLGPAVIWLCSAAVLTTEPAWLRVTRHVLLALAIPLSGLVLWSRTVALQFLVLLVLLVVAGMGAAVVAALREAREGRVEARIFLSGLVASGILTSVDAARVILDADWSWMSPWGFPAIAAACAFVVVRRLQGLQDALGDRGRGLRAEETAESALAHELETCAADLLVVVDRLHSAVRSQEEQLARQSVALQETHATAEEIRVTSGAAADKARALLEGSRVAAEAGEEGERALERTLAGLGAVADVMGQMTAKVGDVEVLSREMAGVARTVRDLADRTNMLALNASLEASRSGAKALGFSVVAREVRRLADESMASADRIRTMLDRVIEGVQASVAASARSQTGVAAGATEVRRSGDELRAVVTLIRDTSSNVRQIAAAVSQQHAGVAEVFGAVDALSRQAREALDLVGETRAVAESIAGIARTMVETSAMDAALVAMSQEDNARAA